MGSSSGGGGPAQRSNPANGRTEAGLPLSRGGRGGGELLWCGALGGRRPGGPGAAAGLGAQPSGCRGGAGRTCCGAPGTAGSRPGPARGGRATRRELCCPAASLLRSRKKAGVGGSPETGWPPGPGAPGELVPPRDALPDAPAEG
ncbi:unnamed protein product [Pipistrellus nathusii]|uniref:Uncharacterized protein n=1 Tax=Pipistrellus nathusii TaxID=59473 RepID=A0ABP0A6X1_PIPNA